MRSVLFLLRRYLLPRQGGILPFALWIAVGGVALGVAVLTVTLAIMSGFQDFLQNAYTRISSEAVIVLTTPRKHDPAYAEKIRAIPGIEAVAPTKFAQAMAIREGSVGGVVLEGVDRNDGSSVTPWEEVWVGGPPGEPKEGARWIWLGAQLAKKLDAKVGDTVELMLPDGDERRVLPFEVTAITKFGIYDHDLRYARVALATIDELFGRGDDEFIYKIRTDGKHALAPMAAELEGKLGEGVEVRLWNEVHQNLFLAVQHQKKTLFLVLALVVGLAGVNVVNLLLMSAHQRRRDIAIARAMGLRRRSTAAFFLLQGVGSGVLGVAAGLLLGLGFCEILSQLRPSFLSESVYNVSALPMRVLPMDLAIVGGFGVLLCFVLSALPAMTSGMASPVEVLRDE